MLNKKDFAKGMAVLTANYPDYPCSKDTTNLYYEFLKDLFPGEFEWVVTAHLKKHKWFPKISELKDEWMELRRLGRLSAAEVWGKLLEAAGRGEKPEMDNITRTSLVAVCGGWEAFELTPTSELPRRFKDFERLYNAGWEAVDWKARTGDPEKMSFLDDNGKVLLEG